MLPLIPIGIGLISFIIGRLTAPSHGEFMSILLSILEHPAVFLLGLALGYLAPSNVSTVASNAIGALQWLKNKL